MRKAPPSDPGASTHRPARPRARRACQHHSTLSIRPLRRRPARLSHPKTQAALAPANHRQKKGSQSYKRPPIPAIVCQHPLLHAIRYQLNFPESPGKTHETPHRRLSANPWHAAPISKTPASSTQPPTYNSPAPRLPSAVSRPSPPQTPAIPCARTPPTPHLPNTKRRSTMQGGFVDRRVEQLFGCSRVRARLYSCTIPLRKR